MSSLSYIFRASILPTLLLLYVFYRVILPRKVLKPIYRFLFGGLLLFLIIRPLIFLCAGGSISSPHLSAFFIEYSGVVLFAVLILAVFILLRDIFLLFTMLLAKIFHCKSLGFTLERKFIVPSLLVAFALSFYGNYNAHLLPVVRNYTVVSKDLPSSFDGFKIAFISDTHVWQGRGKDFMQSVVDITNKQNCQLVLLGGDYLDGAVEDFGEALLPLKNLRHTVGIFAVPGNHEYYFDYAGWKKFFEEKLNITVLINQHKKIVSSNGQAIFVTGVPDILAGKIGEKMPDVNHALPVLDKPSFIILLCHRPDEASKNNNFGIDLQLSGHTHGGLVPFLSKIVACFNDGFVVGQYNLSHMTLIVTRGAGYWQGFAERIASPAEISVITLKCKK